MHYLDKYQQHLSTVLDALRAEIQSARTIHTSALEASNSESFVSAHCHIAGAKLTGLESTYDNLLAEWNRVRAELLADSTDR